MKWISVKDKLPEKDGVYIVFGKINHDCYHYLENKEVFCAKYDDSLWVFGEFDCLVEALYWMPLPDKPD